MPSAAYSAQPEEAGLTEAEISRAVRRAVLDLRSEIPVIVPEGSFEVEATGYSPKFIPDLPAHVYRSLTGKDSPSDTVRVIIVPIEYFYSWKYVTEEAISAVVRHEYGHHLTWEQLTAKDRKDERFRGFVFDLVLQTLLGLGELDWPHRDAEYMYFCHRLRSERIASEAAGLTPRVIHNVIRAQTGIGECCAGLYINVDRLLSRPVAADTAQMPLSEVHEYVMDFMKGIIGDRTREDLVLRTQFEKTLNQWKALLHESRENQWKALLHESRENRGGN